jgi:hypothetical protein
MYVHATPAWRVYVEAKTKQKNSTLRLRVKLDIEAKQEAGYELRDFILGKMPSWTQ